MLDANGCYGIWHSLTEQSYGTANRSTNMCTYIVCVLLFSTNLWIVLNLTSMSRNVLFIVT